ncbi:radical SAM protein [Clostridium sp. UBA6640]|uniref:radical SAM protein n=1 Tax=Clostridium sp. UBA6640 TaxID=1946370 RepID=UPI0025C5AC37|nr:radical SAM protein [Clostridium sp. UBA6640]
MGLSVKWDITYKCNLNCGHCINGSFLNNKQDEISLLDIKNIINKFSKIKTEYVHLLGGEPTFRKDFVDVCNFFKEKNINFGFNTNGLNLMTPKIKDVMFNESLRNIVFSLEGPTAEINDGIRGKNVFDIVVDNIKKIVDIKDANKLNNLVITVNTVVSKQNYNYIIDMIDFCISLGVNEFNLLQLIEDGNAKDKNLKISDEEELDLVKNIALKYTTIKDKIKINPKFVMPIVVDYCEKMFDLEFPKYAHGCGAGTTFCFLNNKGELFPCDRYVDLTRKSMSCEQNSLLNNEFYTIWDNEIFSQPFELTEGMNYYGKYTPCNRCDHLQKDCFPCIVFGLNEESHNVDCCTKYFEILEKNNKEH